MRNILCVIMLIGLSACGGISKQTSSITEEQLLVIRGESLIGLLVVVDETFNLVVRRDDLTPYHHGILGASDREIETLQTLTVGVDVGEHQVSVRDSGRLLANKNMYFSKGQSRELRISR